MSEEPSEGLVFSPHVNLSKNTNSEVHRTLESSSKSVNEMIINSDHSLTGESNEQERRLKTDAEKEEEPSVRFASQSLNKPESKFCLYADGLERDDDIRSLDFPICPAQTPEEPTAKEDNPTISSEHLERSSGELTENRKEGTEKAPDKEFFESDHHQRLAFDCETPADHPFFSSDLEKKENEIVNIDGSRQDIVCEVAVSSVSNLTSSSLQTIKDTSNISLIKKDEREDKTKEKQRVEKREEDNPTDQHPSHNLIHSSTNMQTESLSEEELKRTSTDSVSTDAKETLDKESENALRETNKNSETNQFKGRPHPLQRCGSFPIIVGNGITKSGSQSNLDKLFPLYRLSMRLSHNLSSTIEIPNADSHRQYEKAGYLQKMSGRSFPYLNQWKRRYCILTRGRLFLYEKETSKGAEKSSNVVDLKYFDHVTEALQKETKKVSNVFIVTSQDRSFFDPGRHLFAADTLTEMYEWISKLRESIELIRNNNRPNTKTGKWQDKEEKFQLKGSPKGQKRQSEEPSPNRPKSKAGEDLVDSKIHKSGNKDEFITGLEVKINRRSEEIQWRLKEDEVETIAEGGMEGPPQLLGFDKKISSKKIVLQAPSFTIESEPQLKSVTKDRIRGPSGRRAPATKKSLMKERASSLSALQNEGQLEESKSKLNHQDVCQALSEEDVSGVDVNSLNSSQPILAYHYSSEEDSPPEGDRMGSGRSLGMSPSTTGSSTSHAFPPPSLSLPPPPPLFKSTSFNIEEVPHHPVNGLRVFLSEEGKSAPQATGFQCSQLAAEGDVLFEYRSLPRSLGKSCIGSASTDKISPYSRLLVAPPGVHASSSQNASTGKLSQGRASPEMDALDNFLMKRSLFSGDAPNRETCSSDQEGSDASTCKAVHVNQQRISPNTDSREMELPRTLKQFSSALRHLQHHTVELEGRTRQIESEFSVSKNDVIHLQEATEAIRKDVKKLSETVTLVSHEASKAKKEHVLQRQETEKLQKDATEALLHAKKSKEEFETAKENYELTMRDLHSLISSIRSSLVISDPEGEARETKRIVGVAEIGKSNSETSESKVPRPSVSSPEEGKRSEDMKKQSSKEVGAQQKGGYQSFFQRPSTLIYGLTNKSSNHKKDKEGKQTDANKCRGEEKKMTEKQTEGMEKKPRGEKHSQALLGKPSKSSKKASKHDTNQKEDNKSIQRDNFRLSDEVTTAIKRDFPRFSTENLPMMDEYSDRSERRPSDTIGISHVSIKVNSPYPPSYNLEKSLSSPSVTAKFSDNKPDRPNVLNIYPDTKAEDCLHSNTSSPDSPVSLIASLTPPLNTEHKFDGRKFVTESLFPSQPPRTVSPVIRHSSMPSVPEERSNSSPRNRTGVFAIARQKSSPNIPIQRQSSAPMFPIQRQRSLGTVPEEGQLPRQASLMSVPEERPIVDQTLPLSPASSMVSFALSPSLSGDTLDSYRERQSTRNSMELVTGPVLSGSLIQESCARQLPPSSEFEIDQLPVATSSLKKVDKRKKEASEPVIV